MNAGFSRRQLLGCAALLALAAGSAVRAEEATKESDKIRQSEAQYQRQPKGQQRCAICLQFKPPNRCQIVQGPIVPNGWCQFFAARENAH